MKLTEYIPENREEIVARVESTTPVLLPNSEDPPKFPSKRTPYDGQARVIEAARRTLADKKAVFVIGEMGTGKTLIGSLIPKPGTKIIVLCPGHLVDKWKREIENTRPHATAWIIRSIRDCQKALNTDPIGQDTHWYILSKETAKLSYLWKSAARIKRTDAWIFNRQLGYQELQSVDTAHCPDCYKEILTEDSKGTPHRVEPGQLEKHKRFCPRCDAALWTADRTRNRKIAISDYLKKKHARFDYLIIDEAHEYKAADSAQGNALGALAAISDRKIMLTGTLIGGYATHLYYLLWRVLPRVMKRLDFDYKSPRAFINSYGVRELVTREYISDGAHNRGSKGSSKNQTWNERPGISPRLFTDFLLSNGIYLQLDDLSASLPPLYEMPENIQMDSEQAHLYRHLESELKRVMAPELARGNRRNLSKMLINLLAWPDNPWDNTNIILGETASIKCPNISSTGPTAKERRLIEIAEEARERGSKTLVYCQFTASRDVQPRLQMILEQHGLKTAILRSTVKPEKREQWILDNAPDTDCLICNPEIVKTGLDLYDYTTIVYYQTGYNTFTIRQASRRSWRLGQTAECRIYYLYYADTMQERAIELVAKKLNSATALDGKLSSEGLNAMADDDDAFILAKALMDGLSINSNISFGTPRPQQQKTEAPAPDPLPEISEPANTHWIEEPQAQEERSEMDTVGYSDTWNKKIEADRISGKYDLAPCIIDVFTKYPTLEDTALGLRSEIRTMFPDAQITDSAFQEAIDTLLYNKKIKKSRRNHETYFELTEKTRKLLEPLAPKPKRIITPQIISYTVTETEIIPGRTDATEKIIHTDKIDPQPEPEPVTPQAPDPVPQPENKNVKTLEHYRRLKQEAQAKRKPASRKPDAGQLTLFG